MKTINNDLLQSLNYDVSTLAHCWKITRADGVTMGFTDHQTDITLDDIYYVASTGFTPTAIASNAALKADDLSVEAILDDNAITEADILAGVYDYARIDIYMVDYAHVEHGALHLKSGYIGKISLANGQFHAELRGLTQTLQAHVGKLYSPTCRAQLGDVLCKVDMISRTFEGTVTLATSRTVFTDSARTEVAGTFHFGTLTFLTGDNIGTICEIRRHDAAGTFTLLLPVPHDIAVGDSYRVTHGCDRSFATCASRFNNAVNFRGEPHVPGTDRLYATAGTI